MGVPDLDWGLLSLSPSTKEKQPLQESELVAYFVCVLERHELLNMCAVIWMAATQSERDHNLSDPEVLRLRHFKFSISRCHKTKCGLNLTVWDKDIFTLFFSRKDSKFFYNQDALLCFCIRRCLLFRFLQGTYSEGLDKARLYLWVPDGDRSPVIATTSVLSFVIVLEAWF